jgi:hypothetical protein
LVGDLGRVKVGCIVGAITSIVKLTGFATAPR